LQVFRGSEEDVLDRYYKAALATGAEAVLRITGDCPLTDPDLVDLLVETFIRSRVDYASNVAPPTYPDGLDMEVFTLEALRISWEQAREPRQREHVTPFIRESSRFRRVNITNETDLSAERWTVDEPEDLSVIESIFSAFAPHIHFGWREVVQLRDARPELFALN